MNLYTTKLKAQQIRQAQEDFFELFGIKPKIFTHKIFFYFFEYEGYRYIHKESLRLVYTNGDTYSFEHDTPNFCELNSKFDITFDFLDDHPLLPNFVDLGKFFRMDYIEGEPITDITKEEFYYLKQNRDFNGYTPFYNSMCYNLVRSDKLKLIDLKHFEKIDDKPFFIYLHNREAQINTLYVESETDLQKVKNHLEIDYKVQDIVVYK